MLKPKIPPPPIIQSPIGFYGSPNPIQKAKPSLSHRYWSRYCRSEATLLLGRDRRRRETKRKIFQIKREKHYDRGGEGEAVRKCSRQASQPRSPRGMCDCRFYLYLFQDPNFAIFLVAFVF